MIEKETSGILDDLVAAFRNNPEGVQVGFRELCSGWPWAKRSDAYTHSIHRYPAKMLAYIPIFFLSTRRYADKGDPILDVFAGTGTVLLESIVHPFLPRSAYGIEINPLARLIGKVKTTPVDTASVWLAAQEVIAEAQNTRECQLPKDGNFNYWFPVRVQKKLGRLAWATDRTDMNDDVRDFLMVCLSSIVRKCSYADTHIPVPVHLKADKPIDDTIRRQNIQKQLDLVEKADPFKLFLNETQRNISRMQRLQKVKAIANNIVEARIIGHDAREIQYTPMGAKSVLQEAHTENIPNGSISMVITSPPYGSAQKYVRSTKLEMLLLGLADARTLGNIDAESIGTERIFCEEYNNLVPTGYVEIDTTLERIYEKSHYRAGLASSYFRDMHRVLAEIRRILIANGTLILVVGDNTATGIPIPNHKFLSLIAESLGFRKELLLRDPVRSRGMITKRHATAGMVLDDWILVLRRKY